MFHYENFPFPIFMARSTLIKHLNEKENIFGSEHIKTEFKLYIRNNVSTFILYLTSVD